MANEPVVLLVDDCKNNAALMRAVFEQTGFLHPLQLAGDGDEAIAYLQGRGGYDDRTRYPLPTLVLMDLRMPRLNGFETLKWIRQQPAFERLLVYILSSTSWPEDIERAYELGANSYLVKPESADELLHLAAWLKLSHHVPLADGNGRREPFSGSRAPQAEESRRFKGQE